MLPADAFCHIGNRSYCSSPEQGTASALGVRPQRYGTSCGAAGLVMSPSRQHGEIPQVAGTVWKRFPTHAAGVDAVMFWPRCC